MVLGHELEREGVADAGVDATQKKRRQRKCLKNIAGRKRNAPRRVEGQAIVGTDHDGLVGGRGEERESRENSGGDRETHFDIKDRRKKGSKTFKWSEKVEDEERSCKIGRAGKTRSVTSSGSKRKVTRACETGRTETDGEERERTSLANRSR